MLNEPETSLHPDLLPALGRLIAQAATHTQIFVVTHAPRLLAAMDRPDCSAVQLDQQFGETHIVGQGTFERPPWRWMPR